MTDDSLTPVLVKRDGPRGWKRINKCDFDPAKHELYVPPAPVATSPTLPPLPPLPVTPPGPLDNLPANWRSKEPAELRRLAASVSGGRAVENKRQAIEVIEAELVKRAKEGSKWAGA